MFCVFLICNLFRTLQIYALNWEILRCFPNKNQYLLSLSFMSYKTVSFLFFFDLIYMPEIFFALGMKNGGPWKKVDEIEMIQRSEIFYPRYKLNYFFPFFNNHHFPWSWNHSKHSHWVLYKPMLCLRMWRKMKSWYLHRLY